MLRLEWNGWDISVISDLGHSWYESPLHLDSALADSNLSLHLIILSALVSITENFFTDVRANVDSTLFVPFLQRILEHTLLFPIHDKNAQSLPLIAYLLFSLFKLLTDGIWKRLHQQSILWFTSPLSFSHYSFSHCVFTLWTLLIISSKDNTNFSDLWSQIFSLPSTSNK